MGIINHFRDTFLTWESAIEFLVEVISRCWRFRGWVERQLPFLQHRDPSDLPSSCCAVLDLGRKCSVFRGSSGEPGPRHEFQICNLLNPGWEYRLQYLKLVPLKLLYESLITFFLISGGPFVGSPIMESISKMGGMPGHFGHRPLTFHFDE